MSAFMEGECTVLREPGFPATHSFQSGELEVVISLYTDRWVVLITEVGKVGSVLSCEIEKSVASVHVHLGDRDDIWLRLLGRQLVERTHAVRKLPLVLMCGLKFSCMEDDAAKLKLRELLSILEKLVLNFREGP
jgi:hypothetical protein